MCMCPRACACAGRTRRGFGPDPSDPHRPRLYVHVHPTPVSMCMCMCPRPLPPPSAPLFSLTRPLPPLPCSTPLRLCLPTHTDKLRPLSSAPDPLTSTIEATVKTLTQAMTFRDRDPSGDGFWSAVQSGVALTEATGSVRPLLLAVAALARTYQPSLPQIEGAAAPGMGYRLAKLYHAFGTDLAQVHASSAAVSSQLSALWDWRLLDEGFRTWREELGAHGLTRATSATHHLRPLAAAVVCSAPHLVCASMCEWRGGGAGARGEGSGGGDGAAKCHT